MRGQQGYSLGEVMAAIAVMTALIWIASSALSTWYLQLQRFVSARRCREVLMVVRETIRTEVDFRRFAHGGRFVVTRGGCQAVVREGARLGVLRVDLYRSPGRFPWFQGTVQLSLPMSVME